MMQDLTCSWHCSCVCSAFIRGPSQAEVHLPVSLHVLCVLCACNCKQSFGWPLVQIDGSRLFWLKGKNLTLGLSPKLETRIFDLDFFACFLAYTVIFGERK